MRTADLDLDLLRCFVAVTTESGFTAAGDRLGLTQSAVSLKIRRLEERAGRQLLLRSTRRVGLSDDGELMLSYARRIIALHDEAAARLATAEATGDLRLGIAEYFAPQHLPVMLGRLTRTHPRLRLDVRLGMSTTLVAAFDADELDLVVAKRDVGDPRGRLIATEPMVWIAAGDVSGHEDPLPLITMPAPCVYRETGLTELAAVGRSWRIAMTSSSMLGIQAAVAAGLGVAVIGRAAVLPGMRVLGAADGLPPLPLAEVAVLGEERVHPGLAHLIVSGLARILDPAADPSSAARSLKG